MNILLKKFKQKIHYMGIAALLLPSEVLAKTTTTLPWDSPIKIITGGISGPIAFMFAVGGIVCLALKWLFGGEMGSATKTTLTVVAGISLLVFAVDFLAAMFGVTGMTSAQTYILGFH